METHETIHDWVDSFILDRRIRNLSGGSIEFYRLKLQKLLDWCNSRDLTEVERLTAHHLREFFLEMQEKHSPGGQQTIFRSVRAFLRFYDEEVQPDGWRNPIKRIPFPNKPEELLNPVQVSEVQTLVRSQDQKTFHGLRDATIFLVLLETGVRASELVAIDVSDLDLRTGAITIRAGKGGKVRNVVIGKSVRRQVRKWLKVHPGSEPLFCLNSGKRLTYSGLRAALGRALKETGLEDISLHSFRRSFVLNQLNAGVPETTIMRLLGHSNTQLIAIYAKQTTRHLVETFHSVVDLEMR